MAAMQKIISEMEILLFKLHKWSVAFFDFLSFEDDINRCKKELIQMGRPFTFKTSILVETFFKNFSSAFAQGTSPGDWPSGDGSIGTNGPSNTSMPNQIPMGAASTLNSVLSRKPAYSPLYSLPQKPYFRQKQSYTQTESALTSEKRARLSCSLPHQSNGLLH